MGNIWFMGRLYRGSDLPVCCFWFDVENDERIETIARGDALNLIPKLSQSRSQSGGSDQTTKKA
jgi:hypothetical protein